MPDYETLYPGRFLKKENLAEPKVIRILAVIVEKMKNDENQEEPKALMRYRDIAGEGEMVLNKTNAALIALMFGERDYAKWAGRYITIAHDPTVIFGGKRTGGIRVYGSPELREPKKIEIKRPRRKKAEVYHLVPTDKNGAPKTAAAAPAAAERVPGADDGEDFGAAPTDEFQESVEP